MLCAAQEAIGEISTAGVRSPADVLTWAGKGVSASVKTVFTSKVTSPVAPLTAKCDKPSLRSITASVIAVVTDGSVDRARPTHESGSRSYGSSSPRSVFDMLSKASLDASSAGNETT